MNRYDWLTWALGLLVSAPVRAEAKERLIELEAAFMAGSDKRAIVENILLPGVKAGGLFLARALIELWLGQQRGVER